jgi:hypothetical protein|tara:strand:- start:44 stop:241 length:198 start_codon:yes stop_codon:yes gene_type:complete
MNTIYQEENREELTVCLSEIFTEDELSLVVGSLNSFFSKLISLEEGAEEKVEQLEMLINKIEGAS